MSHTKGSILITGANGGFGAAIVSQIVSKTELATYHGIYTVRNAQRPLKVLDEVLSKAATPQGICSHAFEKVSLDLSRLSSVRSAAADINARVQAGTIPPLRAIVLNAGIEEFATQTWTEDGLDTTFATNYLGHWLLALMLLGSMNREIGRIIWVTSWSHNPKDPHNNHALNTAFKEDKYQELILDDLGPIAKGTWSPSKDDTTGWAAGYRRYGASKLCGVTMIHELQRRLDRDPLLNKVSVLALDPGAMPTGISRHGPWILNVLVFQVIIPILTVIWACFGWDNGSFRTLEKSARDVISAALDCGPPPLCELPKGVFLNGSEKGMYSDEAKDERKGEMIWKGSVKFSGLREGETLLEDWR